MLRWCRDQETVAPQTHGSKEVLAREVVTLVSREGETSISQSNSLQEYQSLTFCQRQTRTPWRAKLYQAWLGAENHNIIWSSTPSTIIWSLVNSNISPWRSFQIEPSTDADRIQDLDIFGDADKLKTNGCYPPRERKNTSFFILKKEDWGGIAISPFSRLKLWATNLEPKLQRFASASAFAAICQNRPWWKPILRSNEMRHSWRQQSGAMSVKPLKKWLKSWLTTENFQNRQEILEARLVRLSWKPSQTCLGARNCQNILDYRRDISLISLKRKVIWQRLLHAFDISKEFRSIFAKKLQRQLGVFRFVEFWLRLP